MTIALFIAILAFACFLAESVRSKGENLIAVGLALLTLYLVFLR